MKNVIIIKFNYLENDMKIIVNTYLAHKNWWWWKSWFRNGWRMR